jgi:hypothetical protein
MTPMQTRAPCSLFLKNILSSIKLRVTIYFRTDPKSRYLETPCAAKKNTAIIFNLLNRSKLF